MPSPTLLAKRICKSPTIAMNDKAKQLAAEGQSVIGLAGGEPDFDTPPHIVDAAVKAIRDGETRYAAPSKGIRPLLEAIAIKTERDNKCAPRSHERHHRDARRKTGAIPCA